MYASNVFAGSPDLAVAIQTLTRFLIYFHFESKNRLLITGGPPQNSLHALRALLNFLLPDIFGDLRVRG